MQTESHTHVAIRLGTALQLLEIPHHLENRGGMAVRCSAKDIDAFQSSGDGIERTSGNFGSGKTSCGTFSLALAQDGTMGVWRV